MKIALNAGQSVFIYRTYSFYFTKKYWSKWLETLGGSINWQEGHYYSYPLPKHKIISIWRMNG